MRLWSWGVGRLWVGLALVAGGFAPVATAGSFITPINFPAPIPVDMTRNAQAWFGERTDPVSGLYEVGLWKDGQFTAFPEGFYLGGISDDASVVSGAVFSIDWSNWPPTITNTGYLWTNGVLTPMASAGEESAFGASVSANGQVVVGTVYLSGQSTPQAFRMEGGVKTLLGTLAGDNASYGQLVTADGSTTAGESYNTETYNKRVFIWREGVLTELPDLPGVDPYGIEDDASVLALSDDGSTVVGLGSGPEGWKLVRWVDGQIEVLWNKSITSSQFLNDVSADGKIVSVNVGGNDPNGDFYGGSMIWRKELGIRSFERYASYHHGLDLGLNPGDQLTVTTMTPDGRYFSYYVDDLNYNRRGYIAYLDPADFVVPEPSTVCLGVLGTVGLMWSARRKLAARV